MPVKTLDDVEREKHNQSREKTKKEISEDVNDVLNNVFKKPKKKSPFSWIFLLLKILGIIVLILIIINLFLGNIWLLKFFIKSLFFGS